MSKRWLQRTRWQALLVTGSLALGACNGRSDAPPPPVDDSVRGGRGPGPAAPEHTGMSTEKKVVVLAGAAALYYLYKHHQSAAPGDAEGQYYMSKNGRVYYRDAEHRAHWVTPPPSGIQVPASEAADYKQFQGYDNQSTGRDLVGVEGTGSDPE